MPSNSTSRRRHSKQHSTSSSSSRKPPPSVISTASLDSASSNTTVKGYSIFPSSLRPSKRPGAKNEQTERPGLHHERSKSVDDSYKENVDVFAYLMEEGGEDEDEDEDEDAKYTSGAREEKAAEEHAVAAQAELSSSSSSSGLADLPPMSPRYSDLEVRAIDSVQRSWGRGSLHSDSGISIRSSSPDQDSPTMHHKLPTVFDEPNTEADVHDNHHMGGYGLEISEDSVDPCLAFGHKHWPSLETNHMSSPEAYYTPAPPRLTQASHIALSPVPADQIVKHASHLERRPAKISKRGYDFLASNIDSRDDALLKPIYRKFEMLNNRMLLYLQDEIAEMEDQLRDLDQAIAHEEQSNGARPASRRMEARLPSQLHWHRVDLLNRSFAKVEQYNRALTSYSKLTQSLEPASHAAVDAYRNWITKNAPIVEQETAFLQHQSDLLSISAEKPTPNINLRAGSALETPVIVVAFGLLATVIVFKVVPQILARLVISAMVGIAALCTLSPDVMVNVKGVREWRTAIATYSAIMLMLAIVVS